MKRIILAPFFVFISVSGFTQNFAGDWYGILDALGIEKYKIVFHIINDSTGKPEARLDYPERKVFKILFDTTALSRDSIILKLANMNIEFKGKLIGDSVINGVYNTQGLSLSLRLTRKAFEKAKRPQTPKPPFNYESKDVIYYDKDSLIQYGATLTYPKTGTNFPAVVLITGTGPEDRDETIAEHKPFAVIADYLTRMGYAVLRIDDRGIGKTTGDFYKAGTKEYIEDSNRAIEYLKGTKNINPNKIGLVGHSLGGIIASIVAAQSKDVAFIISLAGMGVSGKKFIEKQKQTLKGDYKILKSDSLVLNDYNKAIDSLLEKNFDEDGFRNNATKIANKIKNNLLDSSLKSELANSQLLKFRYSRFNSAEQKSIRVYDPSVYFKKIKIPFLAINGTKDIVVDADTNLNGFKTLLTNAGNKNFKLVKLEGLNHFFQECKTCTMGEYVELEETFSPKALKIIGDWLIQNIGK